LDANVLTVPQVMADSEETITTPLPPAGCWKRCSGQATPWTVKLWWRGLSQAPTR
jgi:hypothetical protein